jgi:hypothetical protein
MTELTDRQMPPASQIEHINDKGWLLENKQENNESPESTSFSFS